ncbi:hypothetical protein Prudu_016134 [Prunus dulcis]|uniref:Uncharacterized protein n=1 Tax=Prunus dulcis TaxID=3755 RepID=A0A4Y1RLX9_PRUDU|nr:hypothetical protein Prudu_016134 [Prunus dulcis]
MQRQTRAAPFQLPEAEFAAPKRKKRRHSAVEDVAEEEGTRVETHNSILSLYSSSTPIAMQPETTNCVGTLDLKGKM